MSSCSGTLGLHMCLKIATACETLSARKNSHARSHRKNVTIICPSLYNFHVSSICKNCRKWNIHIIAEPGRKADVPAAPEILDTGGKIRLSEIIHQTDTKHLRCTDRDMAVTAEITIDLYRKKTVATTSAPDEYSQ